MNSGDISNPRLRRLAADYEKIRREFTGHPYVKIEPIEGNPPEKYLVTYRLKGLRLDETSREVVETNLHVVEVYLHSEYPREKPRCFLKTEIFHPNFGSWVCIGDFWASGESMVDVIVQIGDMIQYKIYNIKSPLNAVAAKWVKENKYLFPIGNVDLYLSEPDIELKATNKREKPNDDFEIILK